MNYQNLPIVVEALSKLIGVAAWPLLTAGVIICFRKEIRRILKELKVVGGGDLWAYLGHSPDERSKSSEEKSERKAQASHDSSPFSKGKYGNMFWVGHDLLWTVAQLVSRGPREKILEGLYQSKHHLNEVEFVDPSFSSRLEKIYQEAFRSSESDWTAERRGRVALEIQSLAREIGGVVGSNQLGFRTHPVS